MLPLLIALTASACDEAPRQALVRAMDRAELSWHEMDGEALDQAMADVRTALSEQCAAIEPRLAMQIHLAMARHTWTLFDTQNSVRAYLAVRDLAPSWTEELDSQVPSDHPVRELWGDRPKWTTTLDETPTGGWLVDGSPGPEVPKDRAFVLQALERDGGAVWTGWLTDPSEIPVAPLRAARIRRIRKRGTVVSLGVAGIGAGLLGAGLIRAQDINKPGADLLKVQQQSNALGGSAIGAFVLSGASLALLWGIKW